jgi:hypothetical protein
MCTFWTFCADANYECGIIILRVTNYELVGFADFECIIWQQSTGSDVSFCFVFLPRRKMKG